MKTSDIAAAFARAGLSADPTPVAVARAIVSLEQACDDCAAALARERELVGELTAKQAPLAALVRAAEQLRNAVREDDIGHQCEAEEALLAAVEQLVTSESGCERLAEGGDAS